MQVCPPPHPDLLYDVVDDFFELSSKALKVLPALLLFWIRRGVPESPIYLARTGREAEARTVIDDMVARTGATPEPYQIPTVVPVPAASRKRGLAAAAEQRAAGTRAADRERAPRARHRAPRPRHRRGRHGARCHAEHERGADGGRHRARRVRPDARRRGQSRHHGQGRALGVGIVVV